MYIAASLWLNRLVATKTTSDARKKKELKKAAKSHLTNVFKPAFVFWGFMVVTFFVDEHWSIIVMYFLLFLVTLLYAVFVFKKDLKPLIAELLNNQS
jgi:threonine/homoserine/homoserine lactone efflux protein